MTEHNLHQCIESSREILRQAYEYSPYAIVVAFSGGDDSLTVMELLKYLEVKVDMAIFANTQTAFPATVDFVRNYCSKNEVRLIETLPKKENRIFSRVKEKGFYGLGKRAHNISFGTLKGMPIEKAISKHIRQYKGGRKVIVFSGIRRNESRDRRNAKKYETPFYRRKLGKYKGRDRYHPNIWVSLIHAWEKEDCLEFLDWRGVERNPISIKYNRSGDCHCGSAISEPELNMSQLIKDAPSVAQEIADADAYCKDKGLPRWAEGINDPGGDVYDLSCPDLCSKCEIQLKRNM